MEFEPVLVTSGVNPRSTVLTSFRALSVGEEIEDLAVP